MCFAPYDNFVDEFTDFEKINFLCYYFTMLECKNYKHIENTLLYFIILIPNLLHAINTIRHNKHNIGRDVYKRQSICWSFLLFTI